ncbi:uncharacterized protein LOC114468934 [Gouania willdenowi]|uniref:uncharacterized protein LOC114468934 n=1 Tax=Gouania willdenowi TaxID=441366 RepID=UPI0010548638|nr:uncharacterized protein LOC114468934 [Gouania willdenowi]
MATKAKSHKAMGDGEWMSRLKSFARTGVWPLGGGNRPAPRQKKWHNLYQKIVNCPMQARGQTTIFGESRACNCGFHDDQQPATPAPPAPEAPAATQQSQASDPAAGTAAAGKTFWRPPLSLSMFNKSRFGGKLSAQLKPNLVARKTPSSSSSPSSVGTPSTASVRTTGPAPSPVRTPSTASVRTTGPAPSPVRTPSTASVRTTGPAPSPNESEGVQPGGDQPVTAQTTASFWLPGEMSKTIPVQDQRWIANTLFHSGKLRPDVKLWYEPPVPALIYHQTPTPDRFFTHRLMVWMPYHLWKVRVFCPACGKQLTGYGVHKRARKVLDIDRYYLMVTETLRCTVCSVNYLSTSQTVRDQLDLPHQKMFRLILTRKYACDIRVIRLLRDRTLGNSPARLVKQLKENHGEEWLNRLAHYLGECADFVDRPSLFPVVCQEPPEPMDIPTSHWLLSVYGRDILCRLDHIKASITSIFGTILKMDSTKKVKKKITALQRSWLVMPGVQHSG